MRTTSFSVGPDGSILSACAFSYGIPSVTRQAIGSYTLTFGSELPVEYCVVHVTLGGNLPGTVSSTLAAEESCKVSVCTFDPEGLPADRGFSLTLMY